MSYEPDWNDPVFYAEEFEPPVKCFRCGDTLRSEEHTDTAWCVSCLPSEGESNE